jgi:hypothetical protein
VEQIAVKRHYQELYELILGLYTLILKEYRIVLNSESNLMLFIYFQSENFAHKEDVSMEME